MTREKHINMEVRKKTFDADFFEEVVGGSTLLAVLPINVPVPDGSLPQQALKIAKRGFEMDWNSSEDRLLSGHVGFFVSKVANVGLDPGDPEFFV